MKALRITMLMSAVAALTFIASCAKENTFKSDKNFITVKATSEQTKTSIGYDDTKPVVFWSAGDEICIFDGANRNEFSLATGAGTTSATFTGSVSPLSGEALTYNRYIAIYPYSAGKDAEHINYYDESVQNYAYKVTTSIPTEQLCLPGTFAEGASFAVGASSDPESFFFYNALAYMSFDLKGAGIVSVKVENTEDTPLALSGLVQINFVDSGIKSHPGKSGVYPYVTLRPASGETLAEGTYYLVVYPQKNGHSKLKITATRNDGATAEITYNGNPLINKVNSLLVLPAVDASKLNWQEKELKVTMNFGNDFYSNITYVGTSLTIDKISGYALKNNFEDNTFRYKDAYTFSGEKKSVDFTLYGPWSESQRITSDITFSKTNGGIYLIKQANLLQFMSIPAIENFVLDKVEVTCTSYERVTTVVTSNQVDASSYTNCTVGNYSKSVKGPSNAPYTTVFENLSTAGTRKAEAGKEYYLGAVNSNPNITNITCTYLRVN